MALQSTRRTVVRNCSVLAATLFAGCSMLPFAGDTEDDPDQGKQSFGVRIVNETNDSHTVTVVAWPRGERDSVVFEETADVAPDEPHEWDQVLTDEGMFVVEATVDDDHFFVENAENRRTVVVGLENSPPVKNVLVELRPEGDGVTAVVDMGWDDR